MRHVGIEELPPGDHSVLTRRERRDQPIWTSPVNWMLFSNI
jgi:hypothetical protein